MRNVNIPLYSAEEVYEACISKVRNKDLKGKLSSVLPIVVKADTSYKDLVGKAALYSLVDELYDESIISVEEMKKVYTSRMVKSNSPGYEYYNQILKATKYRTCPFCGHRKVNTLDHFLPKAFYPSLVVTPINLVPSCSVCNTGKSSKISTTADNQPLHPYFDDLGNERFLFSKVLEGAPPTIIYYVKPPISWTRVKRNRLINHFDDFDLSELYSIHSVDEIIGQIDIWDNLSKEQLAQHLKEQSESRKRIDINAWEVALYEGLSESDWFCDGGYKDFIT